LFLLLCHWGSSARRSAARESQ